MTRKNVIIAYAGLMVLLVAPTVFGQAVRLLTQREIAPPDYATFRLGPFYSTMALTERVGYRYTTSSGRGTDFIFNNDRGEIREDGSDFPIISTLTFRNYLIISRNMDLDASFSIGYAYYPLDTQEDEFYFTLPDEGLYGNISSSFRLTPYVYGTLYDNMVYKTDYVDSRGESDRYGGEKYEYFSNTIGANTTWDMAANKRTHVGLSRYDRIPKGDEFGDQERTTYSESISLEYDPWDKASVGVNATFDQVYYDATDRQDTTFQSYSIYFNGREGALLPLTDASTLYVAIGVSSASAKSNSEIVEGEDQRTDDDSSTATGSLQLRTQLSRTLHHTIAYNRGMRDAFNSEYEIYDTLSYRLNWQGDLSSASLFSNRSDVQPSGSEDWDYATWTTGATLSYPLLDWLSLRAATAYSTRKNESEFTDVEEPENSEDYDTWTSSIGTDFRIHKEITFSTSLTHYERISDYDDLAYTRDIFQAHLTYRHQF